MMLNEHRGNTGNRVSFGPVAMALIKKGASFAQCINKAVFSHLGHFAEACGSRTSWAQPNCLPAGLMPQPPWTVQQRRYTNHRNKIRVKRYQVLSIDYISMIPSPHTRGDRLQDFWPGLVDSQNTLKRLRIHIHTTSLLQSPTRNTNCVF